MPFPNSPLDGDTYTDPSTNRIYAYSAANSIWRIKERSLLQDFTSTSALTNPGTGTTLAGAVGGGSYTGNSSVSLTYQPLQANGWGWNGSPRDYPAGSVADGDSVNSTTYLAGSTTPEPGISPLNAYTMAQTVANEQTPFSLSSTGFTQSVCWGAQYTSEGPIRLGSGQLFGRDLVSATYRTMIFKGTEIDYTGITDVYQHPQLVGYYVKSGSFTNGTYDLPELGTTYRGAPTIYTGDYLIFVLEMISGTGKVRSFAATSGQRFSTFEPKITSWHNTATPSVQSTKTSRSPFYWTMKGNLDTTRTLDVSTRQVQYPINLEFAGAETILEKGQKMEVVNGLPTIDFPSFIPTGLTVYDTATSSVYFWNSTAWEAA